MPTHLPNTHRSHATRHVFERQFTMPTDQQPRSGVWQDNPAPPRDRTASPQPAPHKNPVRPQQMNTTGIRSQSRSNKRQTVSLTLWVQPAVKAELQRLAAVESISTSKVGSTFLEEAIRQKLHIQHAVLLQPIIEHTIRKEMRSITTRLALLLARGAYESGQTKRLVVHVLKRYGVNQAMLKAMLDESSKGARATLMRKTPQLETLLVEVAAWLEETDAHG